MIVYVVADGASGEVLSLHHEVDADGRDVRCWNDDILATLPPDVDRDNVMVLSTELDGIPSGRDAAFEVDLQRRTVALRPVRKQANDDAPGQRD